ncbi:MAG: hypothetical protein JW936_02945 [Sedimentisphaerales bacterium]|nr:hypothetical protein [Sedimentisphaerales bacterium]
MKNHLKTNRNPNRKYRTPFLCLLCLTLLIAVSPYALAQDSSDDPNTISSATNPETADPNLTTGGIEILRPDDNQPCENCPDSDASDQTSSDETGGIEILRPDNNQPCPNCPDSDQSSSRPDQPSPDETGGIDVIQPDGNQPCPNCPPAGQQPPIGNQNQPPIGQQTPIGNQNQPPIGQQPPIGNQNQPPIGQQPPIDNQNQPPIGQQPPIDNQNNQEDNLPNEPGGYVQQPPASPAWTMGQQPALIPSQPIDIDAPDSDAVPEPPSQPPAYFNPNSMIDGFLIVYDQSVAPNTTRWQITPDEHLHLRSTQTDNSPGIDLIWPEGPGGGNNYTHLDGALTDNQGDTIADFWIDPRNEADGSYWRYFDGQDVRFLHWVGLEIPNAQEAQQALEQFTWRLIEPQQTPRDWRPIHQVLRYRRTDASGTDDIRYVLVYLMPVDSLPQGYNPVELRLVHRSSGVFLGMDRHMMFVD